MHLRKLAIHALPGIEPGFTFEPPDAGINIVTGPNAIGKSSLARALEYLLAHQTSDPPGLSLEAEFEGGDARWQVSRSGNQTVWRRDGEVISRPALPGADRIGLFRLSVENLLDDADANDKELAERLWRELHGNFDLSQPRIEIGRMFARHEARRLTDAAKSRREVEVEYAGLQRREAELPVLDRRIEQAAAAKARCDHLQQALSLVDAIDARRTRAAALQGFPPEMDRLRGDEPRQLDENEKKVSGLHEELRDRRRDLQGAMAELERTGLAQSIPAPEEMRANEERLRRLGEQSIERNNVRAACTEADAAVRDVLARFNRDGNPPRLDAGVYRRAEEIAGPLIAAHARGRELRELLDLTGEAPDAAEMERLRDGVEALRAWLAGNAVSSDRTRASRKSSGIVYCVALAFTAFAALAAYIQSALVAFAGALAALIAFGVALFLQRGRRSTAPPPMEEAIRRFHETGLAPLAQWNEPAVRKHLREVTEVRLNELTLQQTRAAGSEHIRLQIRRADADIERLEDKRVALAGEIGFDPRAPVADFDRFVHLCSEWDKARTRHVQEGARFDLLDRDIAEGACLVRDFLGPWRANDAPNLEHPAARPDLDLLRGAFDDLQRRHHDASEARHRIRGAESGIRSLEQRITEIDETVETLFTRAGVESRDRAALTDRIEQLPQWKEARRALDTANTEEALVRARLVEQPDLVVLADEGERARLQADLVESTVVADEYADLIRLHAEIKTRLNDAGKDRKLEQAAATEDQARQSLEDKRDEALLAVATGTLLDDVEQAFEAEHEPSVLRRARDLFADVTARAFDLRLRGDGTFIAHDVRQGAARSLAELSSGTRMQLLLALRMAWLETQEQGGEALPLFLDEALTTSDEERFAVVAQSLERLAGVRDVDTGRTGDEFGSGTGDGGAAGISGWFGDGNASGEGAGSGSGPRRQIFYLSARRHEPALWQQATGIRPAVIDLASVRFPSQASAPEDYRIEPPPSLPAPDGRSAETYASLLGVAPRLDPHRPEGGIHLFHLLRDDLALLHRLMDTWRIGSLGQLEVLLASDAAQAALPTEEMHRRLRQRCRVVRTWVELWRQGRGRPVDRAAVEECPAISAIFVDRVADLAIRVQGDGEALVQALRAGEVGRFRSRKLEEVELWLADKGHTDDQERLTDEDRRRLTLQRVAPEIEAEAGDINRVVTWLETNDAGGEDADDEGGRVAGESIGTERIP